MLIYEDSIVAASTNNINETSAFASLVMVFLPLWKNGKIIALIDFGNIGRYRNPFLMDLAWAVHFCCKPKSKKCYSMRLISAFFKGYRSKRTITKNDAKTLVSLILLVEAATIGSSYTNILKLMHKERIKQAHAHINAAKWLINNRAKVESAIVG